MFSNSAIIYQNKIQNDEIIQDSLDNAYFILTAIWFSSNSEAQLLNKIKNEIKSRAGSKVVREAGNKTDKAIDKAKNKAVEAVKGNKKN